MFDQFEFKYIKHWLSKMVNYNSVMHKLSKEYDPDDLATVVDYLKRMQFEMARDVSEGMTIDVLMMVFVGRPKIQARLDEVYRH